MFDIGLFELLVVGGVGLVVIGPDKLPGAIRTGALWIGRIKRSIVDTRREIEQQIGADDIRRELRNEEIMASLEKLREARTQLEQDIKSHTSGEAIEHQAIDEDYDRSHENHHHEDNHHSEDNQHSENSPHSEHHHESGSHDDINNSNGDHSDSTTDSPLASNQANETSEADPSIKPNQATHTKEAGTPPSKA